MKSYLVYRLTNTVTGKSYIGKTNNLPARLRKHKTDRHCVYLNNSIRKHGFEVFNVEVLEEFSDEIDAFAFESDSIIKFNTLSPHGYNLLAFDGPERRLSPESLRKLAKSLQGRKVANKKSSSYIGVLKPSDYTKFLVKMRFGGKRYSNLFNTEIDAAIAYDKIALYHYGEDALINFPKNKTFYLKENLKAFVETFQVTPRVSTTGN